jgi:hypothetical protein
MTLPSVDTQPQQKPQRPLKPVAKAPERSGEPMQTGEQITGYVRRRVDVKMPRHHAKILRDKLRQLQDAGARLMDGTIVSDRTKAVLWIIENEVTV